MDDFTNVIKKDRKVPIKKKDMLDKYNRLPYNYHPKTGYDTMIQNIVLKDIINLMSIVIVDIDIELRLKKSRTKYLRKKSYNCKYTLV